MGRKGGEEREREKGRTGNRQRKWECVREGQEYEIEGGDEQRRGRR